jgi:predicted aspartyl protease
MSNVGLFRTSIGIEHPARRGERRELRDVVVDTGSELTWIPREVLESIAIPRERMQRFILADGRILERDIGFAIIHAGGTTAADHVVFAEGDMVRLGVRALEGLNLRVDPIAKQLVPAGPIITAAA